MQQAQAHPLQTRVVHRPYGVGRITSIGRVDAVHGVGAVEDHDEIHRDVRRPPAEALAGGRGARAGGTLEDADRGPEVVVDGGWPRDDDDVAFGGWCAGLRQIGCIAHLGLTGILMLFASTAWFLWQSSILAEEKQVGMLAQAFATRVEEIITGSIEMLDDMNSAEESRCSREHLQRMNEAAMAYPFVKAIGYWRAEERQCGVGYIQVMELRPPRADRIYDSGVIAWWPSEHTEVGGIRLFLMRFGDHDIAIDPGLLLAEGQLRDRQAAILGEDHSARVVEQINVLRNQILFTFSC